MRSVFLLLCLALTLVPASSWTQTVLRRCVSGEKLATSVRPNYPTPLSSSLSSSSNARQEHETFDFPDSTEVSTLSFKNDVKNDPNRDLMQHSVPPVLALSVLLSSSPAIAAGPDWGIFEGKTGSLLHPVSMASLLLFSLNTGYQGFKWRRQRTIGDDISELKKTLPKAPVEDENGVLPSPTAEYTRISSEIEDLQKERKELSSQGNRDKHWQSGSTLAFVGTFFAIEGPLNTYARAGKLFPGPHLYAGAALVVLWSAAAACVPAMQKGNDGARSAHIALNAGATGLFAWQVVSGWPILLKVWEKTQWP